MGQPESRRSRSSLGMDQQHQQLRCILQTMTGITKLGDLYARVRRRDAARRGVDRSTTVHLCPAPRCCPLCNRTVNATIYALSYTPPICNYSVSARIRTVATSDGRTPRAVAGSAACRPRTAGSYSTRHAAGSCPAVPSPGPHERGCSLDDVLVVDCSGLFRSRY